MNTLTSKKRVAFISLGCPKNTVDTEVMIQACIDEQFEITDTAEQADVVVINTCGFIQSAKEESINTILEMTQLKEQGGLERVVVTGCLSQRYGSELKLEIPEVDAFLGTEQQTRLPGIIKQLWGGGGHDAPLLIDEPGRVPVQHLRRFQVTPKHWAYLKISEGCDQTCTFCAIPLMRGKFRSKPLDQVVAEAAVLGANGCKELVLVSQETASYGKDFAEDRGQSGNISRLLRELGQVEGIEWIRLMYLFPKNITDELIHEIGANPKVVPYVDIPFQHASDTILKRMGRQQTNAFLRDLVRRFRENIPGVALRTTLMVGFPGETEEHFAELCSFVEDCAFEHLGVFTYSDEEGTAAARFADDIPEEVKLARRDQLMALQADIATEKNEALIGQTVQVLVDGISDESEDLLQGRLRTQAPEIDGVVYLTDGFARTGQLVQVTITDAHTYDLAGPIVGR